MPGEVAYIGIDPSLTCTGVALLDAHGSLITTLPIRMTDKKKVDDSVRLFALRQQLMVILGNCQTRPIGYAVEGYPFGVRGKGLISRAEWVGIIKATMFEAGIPGVIVNPMTLKMFASGVGAGGKEGVLAACERYYGVDLSKKEDEADALMLACMAFIRMRKVPATLRFDMSPKQLSALDSVKTIPGKRERILPR